HLARAGVAGDADDLLGGRSPHDGVVDQQDVLAAKLEVDCVQLAPYRLGALRLARHDERSPDVAVLDEALAILYSQMVCHLHRGGPAGVRYGDYDVDIVVRPLTDDLPGKLLAHAQPRLVNREVVDDRIGACEVDELENAGRVPNRPLVFPAMELAAVLDEQRFAGGEIAQLAEAENVEGDTFRSNHVLVALPWFADAGDQGPDAVRIAECHDPGTYDHRNHRVAAPAPTMHRLDCLEYLLGRRVSAGAALQLVRKNVQQHFGIRTGCEVAAVFPRQEVGELVEIREVAVVRQANAIRRVHVERLCLGSVRTSGGRVAHVTQAHIAGQLQHIALAEDIADKAVAFPDLQSCFARGDDTGRVLAAMLQHRQRIVDRLVDRALTNYSDNATHY